MGLPNLFNFGGGGGGDQQLRTNSNTGGEQEKEERYKVPAARAAGRPHDLGWLELLDGEEDESMRLGKVPPGQIIA